MIDLMGYNFTVKISGKNLVLKKYSRTNYFNYQSIKKVLGSKGASNRNKDNFLKSLIRSRQNVFDIISCNVNNIDDYEGNIQLPKFLTLTFAENITDLKEANKEFTNFNKRLSYHLYKTNKNVLKYICVPEFQQRGAIHYHVLYFNLPYVDFKQIEKTWGNGFIFIEGVKDNIEDYARYVAKYINKENSKGEDNYDMYLDKDLLNQKRYFCSRGLKRPELYKLTVNPNDYLMITTFLSQFHEDTYEYENEFIGKVEQNTYELETPEIKTIIKNVIDKLYRHASSIYKRDLNFKDKIQECYNTFKFSKYFHDTCEKNPFEVII